MSAMQMLWVECAHACIVLVAHKCRCSSSGEAFETDLNKIEARQQADAVFGLLPGSHDQASGYLPHPAGVEEEESRSSGQIRKPV